MHFEPAVNTKREMMINLPNLLWRKYLSESAGNGVAGPPGRKNFGGPPNILGLRPRQTATRSQIPTRYCPKVGHSAKVFRATFFPHEGLSLETLDFVWCISPVPDLFTIIKVSITFLDFDNFRIPVQTLRKCLESWRRNFLYHFHLRTFLEKCGNAYIF